MKVYITHCSKKKDDSLKNSGIKVIPEKLYTAKPTQRFIQKCKEKKVIWAIFSDFYGVWFSNEEHEWYEKSPNKVTEKEFEILKENFEKRLIGFDEICFYYNPGRFHHLYKKLLKEVKIKERITLFTHIGEIQ